MANPLTREQACVDDAVMVSATSFKIVFTTQHPNRPTDAATHLAGNLLPTYGTKPPSSTKKRTTESCTSTVST